MIYALSTINTMTVGIIARRITREKQRKLHFIGHGFDVAAIGGIDEQLRRVSPEGRSWMCSGCPEMKSRTSTSV
jgi:hypothetical protein